VAVGDAEHERAEQRHRDNGEQQSERSAPMRRDASAAK
jgi:hypothetical protein